MTDPEKNEHCLHGAQIGVQFCCRCREVFTVLPTLVGMYFKFVIDEFNGIDPTQNDWGWYYQ